MKFQYMPLQKTLIDSLASFVSPCPFDLVNIHLTVFVAFHNASPTLKFYVEFFKPFFLQP
jgi:hypothetical protein